MKIYVLCMVYSQLRNSEHYSDQTECILLSIIKFAWNFLINFGVLVNQNHEKVSQLWCILHWRNVWTCPRCRKKDLYSTTCSKSPGELGTASGGKCADWPTLLCGSLPPFSNRVLIFHITAVLIASSSCVPCKYWISKHSKYSFVVVSFVQGDRHAASWKLNASEVGPVSFSRYTSCAQDNKYAAMRYI